MKIMESLSVMYSPGIRTRNNGIQFSSVTEFVNIIMLLYTDVGELVHCVFYMLVFMVIFCVIFFICSTVSHSFKVKQMNIVFEDKSIAAS